VHPALLQRPLTDGEQQLVRDLLARHVTLTGSPRALVMEREWARQRFVAVMSPEYLAALAAVAALAEEARSLAG
jgi:glutamate synthase domain-containing protein 3